MSAYTYKDGGLYHTVAPRRGISAGTRAGTTNSNGYRVIKGQREHRMIWEMFNGPIPAGYEIDHINGVRSDNHIENLRLATRSQNSQNHKLHRHSKLGIKGVQRRVRGNCIDYMARITCAGVVYCTTSPDVATLVVWLDTMRTKLHGDFANSGRKEG